jgi:hypothetical protein
MTPTGAIQAAGTDPRPAAVTFVTTEHFTLQGARAATIAESTGRASIFLGAVSGGLIALGFLGQASHPHTAFYAFGLILLPTLRFLGLVTFHRACQSGREDGIYGRPDRAAARLLLRHRTGAHAVPAQRRARASA